MRAARLNRAQANVDQAKAGVEEAELNLSYTTIRSPVYRPGGQGPSAEWRLHQPGELCTHHSVGGSPMWVNFAVSEYQLTDWRRENSGRHAQGTSRRQLLVQVAVAGRHPLSKRRERDIHGAIL